MTANSSDEPLPGELHDGRTALTRSVAVEWDDAGISLTSTEGAMDRIAWHRLTWLDTLPEAILIGRRDGSAWRLRLGRDAPPAFTANLSRPPRFGRWIDRIGLIPSLAACLMVSGLVAWLAINTPGWLGRRVPLSWEAGMSDDGMEDLAGSTCHTPAADAALAGLAARLDRERPDPSLPTVRIELIKLDMVNAVALPGGRVLVFDGLVQRIGSPDVLAGVIGHEIGHVRQRHVMQAMLREFGISMVLSGFKSGVTNTLGRMTALRYSREAESEADEWSRQRLAQADVSPIPTADFFTVLAEYGGYPDSGVAAYLNSHPDPESRAMAFRAAFHSDRSYRVSLDPQAFAAVREACARDTRAKPWEPSRRQGPFRLR